MISGMRLENLLRDSLVGLLRELGDGPPDDAAFVLNPGDEGLLGTLRRLSAADASARLGDRSSIAAHVRHLLFGLALLNRWAAGEDDPFTGADFEESWRHQHVRDDEWRALVASLEDELTQWKDAVAAPREWDAVSLGGTIGSVAHLAYHLGAIRQLARR